MPIIPVTELSDPRLKDYAHLTDVALRKARDTEYGLYLAESALVFERAVRAGHRPRSVLVLGTSVDDALAVLAEAGLDDETVTLRGEEPIPVFTGPGELLAELTGYVLHRGLIGSMHRPALPQPAELLASAHTVVVIENVTDPTNVGLIFRSAGAIGADAILVTPRTADPLYRRSVRVSMGTVLQVPWARVGDWAETRQLLTGAGFEIAALALTDDARGLAQYAAQRPERVALLLGSEGDGLTDEALAAADAVVQIPMRHGVDSLNVAAASAVAMWALQP